MSEKTGWVNYRIRTEKMAIEPRSSDPDWIHELEPEDVWFNRAINQRNRAIKAENMTEVLKSEISAMRSRLIRPTGKTISDTIHIFSQGAGLGEITHIETIPNYDGDGYDWGASFVASGNPMKALGEKNSEGLFVLTWWQ